MPTTAKICFPSALPRLDRLFDYSIPEELADKIQIGCLVSVVFGSSKKPMQGIVFHVESSSTYEGKLNPILEVVSEIAGFDEGHIQLLTELSKRNVATIGEILKAAMPPSRPGRYKEPNSEAPHLLPSLVVDVSLANASLDELIESGQKSTQICMPQEVGVRSGTRTVGIPSGLALFLLVALQNLKQSKSTLILTPDFREKSILIEAIVDLGLAPWLVDLSPDQTKSRSYAAHIKATSSASIVIGNRSAALAPVFNLGTICIWEEADDSYTEQSAPYLNTREVALLRQQQSECSLLLSAYSRSSQIQRLVEIGFLKDVSKTFQKPSISFSEPGFRVDSQAHRAIQDGLKHGSVLVQVASPGDTSYLSCKDCGKPSRCPNCKGPLVLDSSKKLRCKWCNAFLSGIQCECGGRELRLGRAGASRTTDELGKTFPNTIVVESTAEQRIVKLPNRSQLVIATPGAEPYIEGGYRAVVLLDAQVLLSRQSLAAEERAIRIWSNAVAKLTKNGHAVLVGVSGKIAQDFALWNQIGFAENEWQNRKDLSLPPAVRIGSAISNQELLMHLASNLERIEGLEVVGPAPYKHDRDEWRLIFKYPYAAVIELVEEIKSFQLKVGSASRVSRNGRIARSLKVRIYDLEVI